MESHIQHSIESYRRLFLDNNEYLWESDSSKDFTKFKVLELIGFRGKIRVHIEILDYRWDGISKKLLDNTGFFLLKRQTIETLKFDFSLCSIKNCEIIIYNESKIKLPEKPKKLKPTFTIYTGRGGFDTLRESSYLFNDDRDDLMMSYEMALGVNRRK
jgi:hypothetical protein